MSLLQKLAVSLVGPARLAATCVYGTDDARQLVLKSLAESRVRAILDGGADEFGLGNAFELGRPLEPSLQLRIDSDALHLSIV